MAEGGIGARKTEPKKLNSEQASLDCLFVSLFSVVYSTPWRGAVLIREHPRAERPTHSPSLLLVSCFFLFSFTVVVQPPVGKAQNDTGNATFAAI